jgi:hypothetical protein
MRCELQGGRWRMVVLLWHGRLCGRLLLRRPEFAVLGPAPMHLLRRSALSLLLAAVVTPAAAQSRPFISGADLGRLMLPYLDVEPTQHGKLVPKFLELRKMVIPTPALFVFFAPSGCMTAALRQHDLDANDDRCFRGEALTDRAAFLSASGLAPGTAEGKAILFVFSPVFEAERLIEAMPDRSERITGGKQGAAGLRQRMAVEPC